jgi:hypothetical protein
VLVLVAYVLTVVAGALAWWIARLRAEHLPVALLLTVGLACDLTRRSLHVLCLAPAHLRLGTGPLEGWSRAAGHVAAAPVHRGLQRMPVVVLPSVARRVVDVTRDPETPASPSRSEGGAIVDVDLSVSITDDTTRGRWLRHVLGRSASPAPPPRTHRRVQRLRLVRPVDVTCEEDTPAPEAQRAPILPPPSSSSPLRPSRR